MLHYKKYKDNNQHGNQFDLKYPHQYKDSSSKFKGIKNFEKGFYR